MSAKALVPLTYGAPTDKCGITVRFGIVKGFFRDEGINLSMRVVYGGPELAAAYSSGEICFGEMGSPPCVAAIGNSANFSIVGGGVRRKAHMYLCARTDIKDWQSLKGMRIGILSRGSCPEWFLRTMLSARGLNPDRDIEFVGLHADYARVVDVIQEGSIDAALAVEPAPSLGEDRGVLRVLGSVHEDVAVPPIQWIVRVANRPFAHANPNLIKAALRACVRSANYASSHVDEWIAFTASHYEIPYETAKKAIHRDLPHLHFAGEIDQQGLQNVLDLQLRLGALKQPLRLESVLNTNFVPVTVGIKQSVQGSGLPAF